ncbi:unnamed protein product [Durusdinium trenchii]|uniref:Uncharacterized protein n=1 Tax=Durusdinium trenchii TaxID=1381693 RepID=A0ABP0SDG0_9DINO
MVNSCDGVSLQPLLRMASCAAAAQLARAERIDIQRDLADLALAAAECVEHAPAGTALMQCVAQRSPGPNWWLPKSMYDEALRNASCTAASGSIPLQVEQPCTSCGEDKTEKSTVEIYRPPPDPVVLWKRFASPHECDALLELAGGLPHLPALAAGAPQGTIRRSLSKALHWDHHPQLAAFQARMLAAAQNWTGEDRLDPSVLAIGEPMNLAAYLNPGDEYRSHCDGDQHHLLPSGRRRWSYHLLEWSFEDRARARRHVDLWIPGGWANQLRGAQRVPCATWAEVDCHPMVSSSGELRDRRQSRRSGILRGIGEKDRW